MHSSYFFFTSNVFPFDEQPWDLSKRNSNY